MYVIEQLEPLLQCLHLNMQLFASHCEETVVGGVAGGKRKWLIKLKGRGDGGRSRQTNGVL